MKVSITLDFDSPDHAIVALNHIDELRKGNFGETTAAPIGEPSESTPAVPKTRKPRTKKADKPAKQDAVPAEDAPSLADVQVAVKGIFETKGAVAALDLLKSMGAERAAELPEDKRAEFIKQAAAL